MPSEIIAVECFELVRGWILCPVQVWEWRLEAVGAVATRFEGAFLSVARGARFPSPIASGSLV